MLKVTQIININFIKEAYGKEIDSRISDTEEISGHGVLACRWQESSCR